MIVTKKEKEDSFNFKIVEMSQDHIIEYVQNIDLFHDDLHIAKRGVPPTDCLMSNIEDYLNHSYSIVTDAGIPIGMIYLYPIEYNVLELSIVIKIQYRGRGILNNLIGRLYKTKFKILKEIAKKYKIITLVNRDSPLSIMLEMLGFRKSIINTRNNASGSQYKGDKPLSSMYTDKQLYFYDSKYAQ